MIIPDLCHFIQFWQTTSFFYNIFSVSGDIPLPLLVPLNKYLSNSIPILLSNFSISLLINIVGILLCWLTIRKVIWIMAGQDTIILHQHLSMYLFWSLIWVIGLAFTRNLENINWLIHCLPQKVGWNFKFSNLYITGLAVS